jgi:hypothetical protein
VSRPVLCTYLRDEGDFFAGTVNYVECRNEATHWSPHRGDLVGAGPVCAAHRCRHAETLEEYDRRVAPVPAHWMAL